MSENKKTKGQTDITEGKLAENELRLAYQRLSYLFENTPLAVIEWDKDFLIKRWSKRAEEIFGWKESEVLGKNIYDPGFPIVYIEDLPAVNENANQLMKGDVNGKLRMNRNNTKVGDVIYCEWYNSVLRDGHENVITILSLVHNVTERIKAEEQKDFEQREKEALINTTDDLIWSVSSDYKLIAFNKAFSQALKAMTGVPSKPGDEILNSDAFPDGIRDFWKESYDKALSGKTFKEEIHTQAINQLAESWRETAFNPIYKDKTVVAVACYSRDITERKKAEKTLVESENYLRTIIQSEPHCVKLLNKNIELEKMNPAGLEMFEGDNLEDLRGKSVIGIINKRYQGAFKNLVKSVFKGNSETLEYEITGLKGTHRWMEIYAVPLKNAEGDILSLLGISLDITQRKKAEEDLQQVNEELRMLSSHLQIVREEERIQIARNVHDELGQQLTGLKLDVNWLKRKLSTADETIKQKINGIIELIDETLQSVRRISYDLRPSLLDDFGLIAALEWHSEEVAKRSEIKVNFTVDMPEPDIPVETETGIFRIYQELLTNAVRHANARVVTSSLRQKDNHLILKVKDDGQGMDPSITGTKKTLGLIGIKERTFALRGKLDFKSLPGKGTEVHISIPL